MSPAERHDTAETRERILEAAERLFADKGYAATSVREITTESGTNVAAVDYHFGGKDKLYLETFRSLLREVRDRRIVAMQRDMTEKPEMDLEGFMTSFADAFMEPLVDRSRGRLFLGFFAHEMSEPHLPPLVFVEEFIRPLAEISTQGLDRFGPPMDSVTQSMCIMSVVGQLMHAIKAQQRFAHHDQPAMVPSDLSEHIRHIVRFSVAGIRACARCDSCEGLVEPPKEAAS